MPEWRRIALTALCGVAGLVCNLVGIPLGLGEHVELRLGSVFPLLAAALAGPIVGSVASAIAALPHAVNPTMFAAHVLLGAAVGLAVRRGEFTSPLTLMFWTTVGPLASYLSGLPDWPVTAFAAATGGGISALAVDAMLVVPAIGSRLGEHEVRRHFDAHFWTALSLAAVIPTFVLGGLLSRSLGSSPLLAALILGALSTTVALVASRWLGGRISGPLRDVFEGRSAKPSNPYLEIADIVRAREWADAMRSRSDEGRDNLTRQLEEREAAYSQLLRLSERLEERLELRGAELEERNFSLSVAERHYREAMELASDIVVTLDLEGRFTAVNSAGERFFGHSQEYLVGRHWRRTLAPGFDRIGSEEKSLLELLLDGSPHELTTVHTAADDEMRILSTRMELVRDEDGLPLNVHCVARDVTEIEHFQRQIGELGRRLESAQRAIQRRDRELNALLSAARVVNSELELDQLLQHIIESAAAQIQAESGFVGLLDEGALTLGWYWRSSGAAWFDQHGPRVERGVTQIVLSTKSPYVCADAAADPETDKEFTKRFGIRSMLAVPIFDQSTALLGAMALHNFPLADGSEDIDPSDMRFLEGLADIAAAAIQQSKLFERVRHQAETDPLSGLFNRRAFETRFEEELHRASRFGRSFSLVLVDIDHLKKINDTYGHPIGDAAICTVADVLQSRLRRHDFAARIGGEEFAALIVEAKPEQAVIAARNLCDAIRKRDVPRVGRISASLGVASFPDDGTTRDELINRADEALYVAKRGGRDRVVHTRDMPEEPAQGS